MEKVNASVLLKILTGIILLFGICIYFYLQANRFFTCGNHFFYIIWKILITVFLLSSGANKITIIFSDKISPIFALSGPVSLILFLLSMCLYPFFDVPVMPPNPYPQVALFLILIFGWLFWDVFLVNGLIKKTIDWEDDNSI